MTRTYDMTRAMLFLILGLTSYALAHADNHGHGGSATTPDMKMGADDGVQGTDSPQSYFGHPDNKPYIYAHIALMVLSWVFALPTGMYRSPGFTPTPTLSYLLDLGHADIITHQHRAYSMLT